jgi:ankyrin repeat protein
VEDEETLNQLLVLKSRYLANEMGDCGRNALHWAIHMKHPEVVAFLLIKGADPRTVTLDGYTPLQLAVLHHSP